ncbi:MAG: sigma-54 dependent transcriptional regulator [Pyrinomonadaceae bacterium]
MAKNKILAIDDDLDTLGFLQLSLQTKGYEVLTATLGSEGLQMIAEERPDLILTDLRLPDMDGMELLQRSKEILPETEVIVISGYGAVEVAVEATKHGAFYFVEKPINLDRLVVLVERGLQLSGRSQEVKQLRGKLATRTTYEEIVGGSKAMQNLYEIIDSVAPSDASILIIGESGTGKELIANAIHYNSLRSKKPFIKVNCAALPKELIESELFGHTRGAFTGATGEKVGLIGQSDGGSLLLDEIAEMPVELQPKLLRVLQERMYTKVGSEKPQKVDFRLITATNREPADAIKLGLLRDDLFYRINTITIRVPPLRERADDILRLAEHFLQIYTEKYKRKVRGIAREAQMLLVTHAFPGNVRELQNIIERAVLLCKGEQIEISDLPFEQQQQTTFSNEMLESVIINSNQSEEDLSWTRIGEVVVGKAPDATAEMSSTDIFEQLESSIVQAALTRTNGNKQAAANMLGIYRPRLYHMMKKHGL